MIPSDGFSSQFCSKQRNPDSVIREFFYLWNLESGIFFLAQSGILGFENWNVEFSSGIRKPTTDWYPESKFHWQRIRNPRCGIQNPRLSWIPFHRTKDFCSLSPPVSSSISDLTNSHKMSTLVWILHWWMWNGIKLSFKSSELEYFCIDYFLAVAPFVQFSYVMSDVDEPWKSWKMNWQFLVSKPCTVWPYAGTIMLLSLPKGLFGDHLQKRQDQKEKIITIITTINACIVETREARGEVH